MRSVEAECSVVRVLVTVLSPAAIGGRRFPRGQADLPEAAASVPRSRMSFVLRSDRSGSCDGAFHDEVGECVRDAVELADESFDRFDEAQSDI
jgi:hypothetical protein